MSVYVCEFEYLCFCPATPVSAGKRGFRDVVEGRWNPLNALLHGSPESLKCILTSLPQNSIYTKKDGVPFKNKKSTQGADMPKETRKV